MRSFINYTTKIVPERYLIDNEKEDDFRGMPKVCDIAHFLCENAHSAQGFLLILEIHFLISIQIISRLLTYAKAKFSYSLQIH